MKIEIATARKIIGIKNADIEDIKKEIKLKTIGVLSSLNREITFYSSKENLDFSKSYDIYSELEPNIQIILKNDYDLIIFIN